ncbi:putative E3 ubiquitin-protein ligase [Clavispora lusitaniae]|nr:hypothetical protein E0198_005005 [Clavispora lusitaniae]KAF7580684.1 Ring finger domain family protein [Clavispora lusitaniae]QFZ30571.1 putative E3 ubiquitin-protein ligase [Clavispora lusitaniae]QFZ36233.1 putative E3 ubiquitin-protein ligase [Clavispora lusitaniae]QFZ41917.1 putative E3 ubiquitin-protein ligase [Clavispora lusitaniae]
MSYFNTTWKKVLGLCGAFLGVVYHRSVSAPLQKEPPSPILAWKLKVAHVALLVLFLGANFAKWAVFGTLTAAEVDILWEKAGYTIWEFVFGFLVFYSNTGRLLDAHAVFKFAGLFLCVWLVKSFHYLIAARVQRLYSRELEREEEEEEAQDLREPRFLMYRVGLGIVVLNVVDALLIFKYLHDVLLKNYIQHNVLITIFGFEILNHYPILLSTSLRFCLDMRPSASESWKQTRRQLFFLVELALTLLSLAMSVVFSLLFFYHYTFPVYMLPAAYNSLKAAVVKTRILVDFRKRELVLRRLQIPDSVAGETCIFCYDDMRPGVDNIRVTPCCAHCFHYDCIRSWLEYSPSCPFCRKKI